MNARHREVAHHDDAIGNFRRFLEVGADDKRSPSRRRLTQVPADVLPCADVDALERLVEDQEPG